jgi:NitT/TauT family transport system ATP-binding protein
VPSAPSDAIVIDRVAKDYPTRPGALRALDDVSLTVRRGELVTLLGPSGCGKSTLLRMVNGLEAASSGTITVFGEDPGSARRAKRFGLVPQTPALLPWRSVRRNVTLLAELNRSAGAQAPPPPERVDELLARVGLDGFGDALPRTLSGGMQQRVSLVRAFASGAPVLLMDEPFAALDEITRADMRYLLLDLWAASGTTVVFVTHSIDEAVALSDRVVVLSARPGRVVADERIDLIRPRRPEVEDDPRFHAVVARLRASLRGALVP